MRILTEPEASLIKQYKALLGTEGVTLDLHRRRHRRDRRRWPTEVNGSVENIGARRLQTVMEKLLEEVSFTASEKSGSAFEVDAKYVNERVAPLAKNTDLSKFIL